MSNTATTATSTATDTTNAVTGIATSVIDIITADDATRIEYLRANIDVIPPDFTFKCDDGDAVCHSHIIQLKCPLLFALMDTRPEQNERVLYLRGKKVAAVREFVKYLECAVKPDLSQWGVIIPLAVLSDEFDIAPLTKYIRDQVDRWAKTAKGAATVYEMCKDVPILRGAADAAFLFMVGIALGETCEYRCVKCGSTTRTKNALGTCTHPATGKFTQCSGHLKRTPIRYLARHNLTTETKLAIFDAIYKSEPPK
jgi:hypothetical protein